ncbi:MSHA biogenesis protein MshD [Marinobacter salinus]|uniref:MSHA biogenesis protein MshD n=1 Tax=Marinobacter salinus TaxID=1874317 RepID=A0A1D9GMY4_9GAMM|nr:type II secretion system protein [Marinobacter salinus]AOY88875.1 MSHA biogenesis protein MshD [Marinobacter salinus]
MSRAEQGATLVELVITIVIISVAIAGVVGAFSLITGRSADPLNQTRAIELAQLYMDEILTRKYDDSTSQGGVPKYSGACNIQTEAGETRATFDDVDDYDGLIDSPPRSAEGALTGYNGFSVSISVVCAGAEVGLPASEAKRIDLDITAPGNQSFVLSAYRANF